MESLVGAGKVRYIGVSNFSVAQVKAAQAALSKAKIVSNQVEYSLVKRAVERELLAYCQQNGITVIAYSPLAVGLTQYNQQRPSGGTEQSSRRNGKVGGQRGVELAHLPACGRGYPQGQLGSTR